MPEDTEALRRAIRFRCEHVGMLEVETLLKRWCDRRLHELNDAQLRDFHERVLQLETTDLYSFFFKGEKQEIGNEWLEEVTPAALKRGTRSQSNKIFVQKWYRIGRSGSGWLRTTSIVQKMDHRLSQNGQRVLAGQNLNGVGPYSPQFPLNAAYNRFQVPGYMMGYGPVYQSWAPANDRQSNVRSMMMQMGTKSHGRLQKRKIVDQLHDITTQIDRRDVSRSLDKGVSRMDHTNISVHASRYEDLMQSMHESQEKLEHFVKSQSTAALHATHQPAHEYHYPIAQESERSPMKEQYRHIRDSEEGYNNLLDHIHRKERELKLDTGDDYDPGQKAVEDAAVLLAKSRMFAAQRARRYRGKRLFRIAAFAVFFPFALKSFVFCQRQKNKQSTLQDMYEAIRLYMEVAKAWMVRAIRQPLRSIISDPELDLDVLSRNGKTTAHFGSKVLKIKIRIQGILEQLLKTDLPQPIFFFIRRFISNRNFIPVEYISAFEKNRLSFDTLGGLKGMDAVRRQMLTCTFFISRVLITQILLNPRNAGISVTPNAKMLFNLKIIASVLQHMVLLTFLDVGRTKEEAKGDEHEIMSRKPGMSFTNRNDDKISRELFTISEMTLFYQETRGWTREMAKRVLQWAHKVLSVKI